MPNRLKTGAPPLPPGTRAPDVCFARSVPPQYEHGGVLSASSKNFKGVWLRENPDHCEIPRTFVRLARFVWTQSRSKLLWSYWYGPCKCM